MCASGLFGTSKFFFQRWPWHKFATLTSSIATLWLTQLLALPASLLHGCLLLHGCGGGFATEFGKCTGYTTSLPAAVRWVGKMLCEGPNRTQAAHTPGPRTVTRLPLLSNKRTRHCGVCDCMAQQCVHLSTAEKVWLLREARPMS
jgi:hypothetical protein